LWVFLHDKNGSQSSIKNSRSVCGKGELLSINVELQMSSRFSLIFISSPYIVFD